MFVSVHKLFKLNLSVLCLVGGPQDPGTADGGTYRCHVRNDFGESNANLNLNIEAEPEPEGEGPTFIEKPRILSENNGKLVIMECRVKACPKPEITWTKEGEVITETSQIKLFESNVGDSYTIRLELSEPNLEDSGLYKCNIKNTLGEVNANLTLNIESKWNSVEFCVWLVRLNLADVSVYLFTIAVVPVIKDKPKIIKIIKKRTVIIECVVVSKFAPKCTWIKERNEIAESERHKIDVTQIKDGEFAVQLEISKVKETDKGSYQLIARNEKGEAVSQIVELIDLPTSDEDLEPIKPEISRKLFDQDIEETKTLELNASIKFIDKKAKVIWYRGAKVINDSIRVKQTFDGKRATLRITKTKSNEHSGTYKCVIKNEVGQDETTASITVKKVEERKKTEEEESVEETIEVEVEEEEEEEEQVPGMKRGPFDVMLKKTIQIKTVISVSFRVDVHMCNWPFLLSQSNGYIANTYHMYTTLYKDCLSLLLLYTSAFNCLSNSNTIVTNANDCCVNVSLCAE